MSQSVAVPAGGSGVHSAAPVTYHAPEVRVGETVEWHRTGMRSQRARRGSVSPQSTLGTVVEVGANGLVSVRLNLNGNIMSCVPHVDDPRLQQSVHQRENGAWEKTEYEKGRDTEMSELRDRVSRIEDRVGVSNGKTSGLKIPSAN